MHIAKALEPVKAPIKTTPFDFDEAQMKLYSESTQIESFRFIDWENFSADMITLPIDKIVASLLLELY